MTASEREAILIMFGETWRRKFWPLDGQKGRPSINDCIDLALHRKNSHIQEDLVDFLENYLNDMARRCKNSAIQNP